jgi:Ala-tRNA(Pro) deacylase
MSELLERIKEFLEENNVNFTVTTHKPVHTSEEAAAVRGTDLKTGAKAMIIRSEGRFYLFVICADRKIDFKKVREILNSDSVSFATEEEVMKISGCKIGAVPPFGNLFGVDVYVDKSLLSVENINFNAGRNDTSIFMKRDDFINATKPNIVDFSQS